MTRKELIKAIYDSGDMWSCPNDPCDLPEEEGNTGECCWKCAEKQLAKYEAKIRADVIDKFKNAILPQFCAYCDQEACEGGCAGSIQQCYAAVNLAEVINDIAEELKEQKDEHIYNHC